MKNSPYQNSDKVITIYQAVISLLKKGQDINSMKVSDITGEAGIGKGTAYEYFKTKEEIIAKAIHYDMEQQCMLLHEQMEGCITTENKIRTVFDWIDEKLCDGKGCKQIFRAKGLSGELTKELAYEVNKEMCQQEQPKKFTKIVDNIIHQAQKENLVASHVTTYMSEMVLISGFIEYFMYCIHAPKEEKFSDGECREFIYQGMMKRLQ